MGAGGASEEEGCDGTSRPSTMRTLLSCMLLLVIDKLSTSTDVSE